MGFLVHATNPHYASGHREAPAKLWSIQCFNIVRRGDLMALAVVY